MVQRVTNQAQQATALQNIFRITEGLFKANERIATGKRINNLSDDPTAIRDSLSLKNSISQIQQFQRNIDNNVVFLQNADTALGSIGLGLVRARELSLGALAGTDSAETRQFAAIELGNIIDQALQSANSKVKNQYLFSGTELRTEPFMKTAGSSIVYLGNSQRFEVQIANNSPIPLTIPGSEMLATDLNPLLTGGTLLSDLNAGAGVPPGSFTITDRGGNTATINIPAGGTINSVISAINGAGLNVTASINAAGNGLALTDNSPTIVGSLTVAEAGGGHTAQALGIEGRIDGNLMGRDIDPRVTGNTLISDLNGGQGLNLTSINIVNGAASGVVDLSGAASLNDVLATINGSGFNVTATINTQGNALEVNSNSPNTAAIIREVGTGKTAEALGIGGGRNVFVALTKLREALAKDDSFGILASLDVLETTQAQMNNVRAEVGAIQRRLDQTGSIHESDIVTQSEQLSLVQDADITKEASTVAQLDFALNATLNTTARIIQPSLLDFLR
ncbi:MAG: flagellar hook-associated protein FlgL [Nitrospina sp.]|nr:flagellar hook-associated protein FlgL [Nitrospina sp.]